MAQLTYQTQVQFDTGVATDYKSVGGNFYFQQMFMKEAKMDHAPLTRLNEGALKKNKTAFTY